MQKKYAWWIDFLFGPLLRVIGFFYRSYVANRARLSRFMANPRVATFFKIVTVLVLVGWILIWMFASEESRSRLTEEVRQTLGGFERGGAE
jgi:hypothetical protein